MFEISAQNGLRDVILGSEGKTSDLAAHFSRNSGAANTVLFTIQTLRAWQFCLKAEFWIISTSKSMHGMNQTEDEYPRHS